MKSRFLIPLLFVSFVSSTVSGQQGVLDPTFGPGNYVEVMSTIPDFVGNINAIAIQPDNKIVTVGGSFVFTTPSAQGFSITRHLPDGPLDPTFAGDGSLLIIPANPPSQVVATARAVAVLPDGRIVVAGDKRNDGVPNAYFTTIVWLNPDGSIASLQNLDLSPDFLYESANGIAVQSDGKVVLIGEAYNSATGLQSMTLVRLNSNGTLDNSFDGDGILYVDLPGTSRGYDVHVQSDGKIVASGAANPSNPAVVRLNSNGSYDNSFDGDGRVVISHNRNISTTDLEVLPDGKYLLAAGSSSGFSPPNDGSLLLRLLPNGSPDNSFDGDGKLPVSGQLTSMVLQADGKIILENLFYIGGLYVYGGSVQRRLPDGNMDPSFGNAGFANLAGSPSIFIFDDLALQSDGRIIVGGTMSEGIGRILARLTNCVDVSAPQLVCNSTVDLCYNSLQKYTVPLLTATDNCTIQSVNFAITGATTRVGSGLNASGSFNLGTSTILWTVTDASGNSSTCQTTVNVNKVEGFIPDVFAIQQGGDANTLYKGYGPQTLTLTVQTTQGTAPFSFIWSTGSLSASTIVNPSSPGFHNYTVTITDSKGCSAMVGKQIAVVDVRCGNKDDKVAICHGDKTSCVSPNAVPAQLKNGRTLGDCSLLASRGENHERTKWQPLFSLTVSPNPASNYFLVSVQTENLKDKIKLTLYDVTGKQVLVKNISAHSAVRIGEELTSGVYFIKAEQGGNLSYLKLIKTK